jgi:hypothetical protein
VAIQQLYSYAGWGGRIHRLDTLATEGAADITLIAQNSGDTIYRSGFCTLFQEWLVGDDSSGPRAMQGTILVPFPRQKVVATISLRDNSRHTIAHASTQIDPADILIRHSVGRFPSTTIFCGTEPDSAKINVAILAEGFTQPEMPKFIQAAIDAVDAILEHQPFADLADHFNFVAFETPSADSGVSIPRLGRWRSTAFSSHFSTFYSDRYLTAPEVHRIYDAIAGSRCQHIIILANSNEYGGGGIYNFYTISATGCNNFRPVIVHEFAHALVGLADEYFYDTPDYADSSYPLDVEPWEPNITTQVDFQSKWADLVAHGQADLIPGGGYRAQGIWRSATDCRMRSNSSPDFCPACTRAIIRTIHFLTD